MIHNSVVNIVFLNEHEFLAQTRLPLIKENERFRAGHLLPALKLTVPGADRGEGGRGVSGAAAGVRGSRGGCGVGVQGQL